MITHPQVDRFLDTIKRKEAQENTIAVVSLIRSGFPELTEHLKYGLPFYHFKGKGLCYVTYHVTVKTVVVGFMDGKQMQHPLLKQTAKQKRVRHLIYEASEDWPEQLYLAIQEAMTLIK